ncbi:MAG: MarR family winged helix-turn-helix transcriptional regulator [Chloroflexota bacterium]
MIEDRAAELVPSQAIEHAAMTMRRLAVAMQTSQPGWLDMDLTVGQIRGLFALASHGPMTIGQVAETLRIRLPWASTLVDRLVEVRLVQRGEDPADRRRTLAWLTPSGEALVTHAREGGQEHLRACLEKLAADDLTAFVRGLDALAAVIGDKSPACK